MQIYKIKMLHLIIFILASISLTNIIGREFIFEWFRKFVNKHFRYSLLLKILNCSTCLGFWTGLLIALLFPILGIHWFLGGLISSICMKTYELTLLKF